MKIDIKMMVIIGLALVVVGFIMFGGKGGVDTEQYEKERAEWREQIDSLEVLKDGANARIGDLEESYNKILKEYDIKVAQNDSLIAQIEYQSSIIDEKTKEYNIAQKKIKEMNNRLSELKANPPNREGDDLINNLQKIFN